MEREREPCSHEGEEHFKQSKSLLQRLSGENVFGCVVGRELRGKQGSQRHIM